MERHLVAVDDKTMIDYAVVQTSKLRQLADACRDQREAGQSGDEDIKVLAHVDAWICEDWCNRKGVLWRDFMRDPQVQADFLNDPANAPFRVYRGYVGAK